ncbi:hypothetical protein Hanom_Chr08g00721791 [Helianthus anomalus]
MVPGTGSEFPEPNIFGSGSLLAFSFFGTCSVPVFTFKYQSMPVWNRTRYLPHFKDFRYWYRLVSSSSLIAAGDKTHIYFI